MIRAFESLNFFVKVLVGAFLIAALGFVDLATGYELSFSIFYVLPVSLLTWTMGRNAGLTASILSACTWFVADNAAGHIYSNAFIPFWNMSIRLGFFLTIAFLLSGLREALKREQAMARTDTLTGAVNSRLFLELAQSELERLQRYKRPFTIAYVDLDNFKMVNDQFGHAVGDEVLQVVVDYSKHHLRTIDIVARLGGDEFALLMPETNEEAARTAIATLQGGLVAEMQRRRWPVTVSIGALTCVTSPPSVDELVRVADELMYDVKRAGKNATKHASFTD